MGDRDLVSALKAQLSRAVRRADDDQFIRRHRLSQLDRRGRLAVGDEVERACAQSGDRVHSQHQTQQHGENRLPPVEREDPLLPVC